MKKLIFGLLLLPCLALAEVKEVSDEAEMLSDQEIAKKAVSAIHDVGVEERLIQSGEFKKCVEDAKFNPQDQGKAREDKLKIFEKCVTDTILEKNKDPKALQQLSDSLGLETYGLVPSKDGKAIRNYLSNKLYKALTGIDREAQKTEEMLKFENRRLVDQQVFIELYKNHIAKSVMFEISRFCIENLRDTKSSATDSFVNHWSRFFSDGTGLDKIVNDLSDNGTGAFGAKDLDTGDAKKSYDGMFKGIGQTSNPKRMGVFFVECASVARHLCDKFKKKPADATDTTGSVACLTLSRLRDGRKALQKVTKVNDQFEKDLSAGTSIDVGKNGAKANFFAPTVENSYDTMSSMTSYDLLEGGRDKSVKYDKLLETCKETPEASECKDFVIADDSKDKAMNDTELQLRLQKQLEIAKIKKMDQKSLDEYLEENGYLDLKEKLKADPNLDIAEEIGKSYDAKRIALIESMKQKLGSRQMSEKEFEGGDKKEIVEKNIKDVAGERARMAQVVLFNNIVTGYLDATNLGTGKSSLYASPWKREQKALEGEASVDESLFANFKSGLADTDGSGATGISDLGFLDNFLGSPQTADADEKKP